MTNLDLTRLVPEAVQWRNEAGDPFPFRCALIYPTGVNHDAVSGQFILEGTILNTNYFVFGTITTPENAVWSLLNTTHADLSDGASLAPYFIKEHYIDRVILDTSTSTNDLDSFTIQYLPLGRAPGTLGNWVNVSGMSASGATFNGILVTFDEVLAQGIMVTRSGGTGGLLGRIIPFTSKLANGDLIVYESQSPLGNKRYFSDLYIPGGNHTIAQIGGVAILGTGNDVTRTFTNAILHLGGERRAKEIRTFHSHHGATAVTIDKSIDRQNWTNLTIATPAASDFTNNITPDLLGQTATSSNGWALLADQVLLFPIADVLPAGGSFPTILDKVILQLAGGQNPNLRIGVARRGRAGNFRVIGLLDTGSLTVGGSTYTSTTVQADDEVTRIYGIMPGDYLAICNVKSATSTLFVRAENPTTNSPHFYGTWNIENNKFPPGSLTTGSGDLDYQIQVGSYFYRTAALGSGDKNVEYVRMSHNGIGPNGVKSLMGLEVMVMDEAGAEDLIDFNDQGTEDPATLPFQIDVSSFGPFPAQGKGIDIENIGSQAKTTCIAAVVSDALVGSFFTEISFTPATPSSWVAHCLNNDITNGTCLANNRNYRKVLDSGNGVAGCGHRCDDVNGVDPITGFGLDGATGLVGTKKYTPGIIQTTVGAPYATGAQVTVYVRSHVPSGQTMPDGNPTTIADTRPGELRAGFTSAVLDS